MTWEHNAKGIVAAQKQRLAMHGITEESVRDYFYGIKAQYNPDPNAFREADIRAIKEANEYVAQICEPGKLCEEPLSFVRKNPKDET